MAASREVLGLYRGQVGKQAERKEWLKVVSRPLPLTCSASKALCSQGKFPVTHEKSQGQGGHLLHKLHMLAFSQHTPLTGFPQDNNPLWAGGKVHAPSQGSHAGTYSHILWKQQKPSSQGQSRSEASRNTRILGYSFICTQSTSWRLKKDRRLQRSRAC